MRPFVSICLLSAASVFAAEKTPPDQTPPPAAEDPMAGAKREFEGIKAARGVTEQSKAAAPLPIFTVPELSLGTPTPKTKARAKTAAELLAEKKSANWLVDAMMKKDPKDEVDSLDQKVDLLAKEQVDTKKTTNEKTDTKPEASPKGPELNPLTRYMSGWMTPQDYSLLKSGMNGPTAESLVSRGDTSGAGSVMNAALPSDAGGGALDLMALSRTGPAPSTATAAAGNPYLQGFAPPAQNFQNFSPPPAAMSPAAPAPSVFTPPTAPATPTSRIPDFAKPAADEKYFKQLKRF